MLFWNFSIRFMIQQFQPFVIVSMISFQKHDLSTIVGNVSAGMAYVLFLVWHVSIIAMSLLIRNSSTELLTAEFGSMYGTLMDKLNISSFLGRYWNVYLMIRWSYFSGVLVYLREYPSL